MKKGYFVIINLISDTIDIYDISIIPKTSKGKEEKKRNTKSGKKRKNKYLNKQELKRVISGKGNSKLRTATGVMLEKHRSIIRTPSQKKRLLRKGRNVIKFQPSAHWMRAVSPSTRTRRTINKTSISKIKRTR